MQVTPIALPVLPQAQPQEIAAKATPNVVAQASAPLMQRAIVPADKGERGHESRSNGERAKGGKGRPDRPNDPGSGESGETGKTVDLNV